MSKSNIFNLRPLLEVEKKDGTTEYNFNATKILATTLDVIFTKCKKENTDFSFTWTLKYKQDEKDTSFVYPHFTFDNINQNNINILLDALGNLEDFPILHVLLKIINTIRKNMDGVLVEDE